MLECSIIPKITKQRAIINMRGIRRVAAMNLRDYVDKKIKITLTDDQILIGQCIEFTNAIENDPEIDSIDLKVKKDIYEIYVNEIKEIEIL